MSWVPTSPAITTGRYQLEGGGGRSSSNVWAVGKLTGSGAAVAVNWDGASYTEYDADAPASKLHSIAVIAAGDAWACGGNEVRAGGVLTHWDGGAFTSQAPPTTDELFDIFAIATDDVWVCGANGIIHHFNGSSWSQVSAGETSEDLYAVYGAAANDVWFGGANGAMLHWNGSALTLETPPTGGDILCLSGVSSILVYGGTSVSSIITWNGSVWGEDATCLSTFESLRGIWADPDTNYPWAVGSFPFWLYLNQSFNGVVVRPVTEDAGLNTSWLGGSRIFGFAQDDIWAIGVEQIYRLRGAPGSGVAPSTPTVTLVRPPEGEIASSTPGVVDVTNPGFGLSAILLATRVPSLSIYEVIHDGSSFAPAYQNGSTRTPIEGGWRYSFLRAGGWPVGAQVEAKVLAVSDSGGVA